MRLENGKTITYIKDEPVIQCKSLFLVNPQQIRQLDEITSIDDVITINKGEEISSKELGITPEEEFWGHCSNLQAWAENDYDTTILHSELAFELLAILVDVGDKKAKKVFKKELMKRFEMGYLNTFHILLLSDNMNFLNREEQLKVMFNSNINLRREINETLEKNNCNSTIALEILMDLINRYKDLGAKEYIKKVFKDHYKESNEVATFALIDFYGFLKFLKLFKNDELTNLLCEVDSEPTKRFLKALKRLGITRGKFTDLITELHNIDKNKTFFLLKELIEYNEPEIKEKRLVKIVIRRIIENISKYQNLHNLTKSSKKIIEKFLKHQKLEKEEF
ncbi:hypothetical protein LCGC14_1374860 [marine sediment metagenome]|uniref:Uncharacterized protein n=1 Tax=marine sediment metagenome TaxID=412755 RepID=A0A0F9K4Q8_9ZZZZ